MEETLELSTPTEAPARPTALVVVRDAALAPLVKMEATLIALAERYRDVAFDLKTAKGLDAAKAARLDLRENGRFAVQRARDKTKAELNDAKTSIETKATALIAIVQAREDEIDAAIKAREAEIEAIKAEERRKAAEAAALAARLEAERKQRHEDGISTLAGYVAKAQGKTAAELARGIAFVEGIRIDPAHWEEFTERATTTLAATLQSLRDLYAATLEREQEAARVTAQRIENERIAAELAAQRAELARQQAEVDRRAEEQRQAELARQRDEEQRAEHARQLQREADAESVIEADSSVSTSHQIHTPRLNGLIAIAAAVAGPHMAEMLAITEEHFADCSAADGPTGDGGQASAGGVVVAHQSGVTERPAAEHPVAIELPDESPATLKLGQIAMRLGFVVTREFLADIGIVHAARDKNAVLYRESQWPRIKTKLIEHITDLA